MGALQYHKGISITIKQSRVGLPVELLSSYYVQIGKPFRY